MILASLLTVVLAASFIGTTAQQVPIVYDSIHNATDLQGTWSSGAQNVVTGPSFANPSNMSFNYPKTTGISYSFLDSGYFESARYRFNSNGSQPNCITGVVLWIHGNYTLNPNGSITLTPYADGYQQIQDPCAAVSNFVQPYFDVEYYPQWRIFQDPTEGFHLHLWQFDGSPLAPQGQVSTTPNMLPTQLLRNVTDVIQGHALSNAKNLLVPWWMLGAMTAVAVVLMAI